MKDLETITKKETIVDTLGNVSYSLAVGTMLDWSAGLHVAGIIASRTSATAINAVTGGLYGKWRDAVFQCTRTNEESTQGRKYFTDLLAFNTFQTYVYAVGIAIGSIIDNGEINGWEIHEGMENLVMISPLIAPTLGSYMNWLRRRTNLYSAAEKVSKEEYVDSFSRKIYKE